MTKPVVAIVGRPNVGKSTLFNRLLGERRAIVDDSPGTTRDRIYGDVSWAERGFTVVDTGGLELKPISDLRHKVNEQVRVAIEEAEVIILLVDVCDGVTIPDIEMADLLRRSGKPVVLAVNKCDNEERSDQAVVFHELALGKPWPISAYHGIGIDDLMQEVGAKLPPAPEFAEPPGLMKLAIVGRTNVGKSMLLNAILGQERAIVNNMPGTTRDAIDTVFSYNGQPVLLIDTAGIRRRGQIETGVERYSVLRALKAIGRADVAILVTEATELPTAQDAHIAGYVEEALKGLVLVVNKWDLIEGGDSAQYSMELRRRLKFVSHAPILFTSAKLRWGIEDVLATAKRVYQERLKELPASSLEEVVAQAVMAHAPRSVAGKRLKVYDVKQDGVAPPTFVFLVNDPRLLHFSYKRYLENRLRERFGFSGIPLHLIFKMRGKR